MRLTRCVIACVVAFSVVTVHAENSRPKVSSSCEVLLTGADGVSVHQTKHKAAVSVFASLPKDKEQFQRVYGEKTVYSTATAEKLTEARKRLAQLGERVVLDDDQGQGAFAAFVKDAAPEVLYVIAHNDGKHLIFTDGSKLEIEKAAEVCHAASKFCIFLTCEADRVVPKEPPLACYDKLKCAIGATTAVDVFIQIATFVDEASKRKESLTVHELDSATATILAKQSRNKRVEYVVMGAVAIALIVTIYSISSDDDQKDKKKNK